MLTATQKINFITPKLLHWYRLHKRDLPWRHTQDPYKIWISEIMLQQTQVATVIPYYNQWFKSFPTLASLARSNLSKVLRHWAGLGYYRRARMLHQAAQYVQNKLQGKFPNTAETLRLLPGIGRYTAGAIASIAFNERTPVLDGNVIRILTRIFGITKSVDLPRTLETLWKLAALLLPKNHPGDMNQALMELGATICSPWNPQCPQCPVKRLCIANKKGKTSFFPVRSRKEIYQKLKMAALILQNNKKEIWVEKQRTHDRWGGLWMFPYWESKGTMLKDIKTLSASPVFLLAIQHGYTKYRITLEVYGAKLCGKEKRPALIKRCFGRWISVKQVGRLAFPSPHRKIVDWLMMKALKS